MARLDLLGNAVISLARAAIAERRRGHELSGELQQQITALAVTLAQLAGNKQPWQSGLLADVARAARAAVDAGESAGRGPNPLVGAILAAAAGDLLQVSRLAR